MTFIKIANFQPPAVYSQQQQQFCFCKIILNCNIYCQIHKLFSQVMWFVGMRPYLLTLFYCLSVFPALVALINFTEAWNKSGILFGNPNSLQFIWRQQLKSVRLRKFADGNRPNFSVEWKCPSVSSAFPVPHCQQCLTAALGVVLELIVQGVIKKRGQEAPPINLV